MADDVTPQESPLCRAYSDGNHTVSIDIYADDEGGWLLEIVDENNNTTVWEDAFDTDEEALQEALDALKEEGVGAFIGPAEASGSWEAP
ncbi:hypothetical protein [Microbulbifer hydrolyticus]|uniref:RNase H-like HicB family nuclease n=1 Tax=Microbulbifer hydrolyticus TaxID=48074 RepID=A0A6P1TCD4_9GAMM|nr:hypothetical protein [Microbulbifer hydrolyticus]MBB5212857.1 putative RNase H-like HicB family nuclease [Microbulbifer hydrolyticus]QHQ38352.1 hypothetical protein GTQ55_04650 [Microbulbifer hydrolyticus]